MNSKTSKLKNTDIKELKQKLEVDGYVIIDNFLDSQQIQNLKKIYHNIIPDDFSIKTFQISQSSSNISYRKKIYLMIKKNIQENLKLLFPQYNIYACNFIYKNGEDTTKSTEVKFHQHPIQVDESKYISYIVWCPLVDVDENNGCLKFIKRSHKLSRFIKKVRNKVDIPKSYLRIMNDHIISVPMKAGQVVIFDERIIHGSSANMSKTDRIAFLSVLAPSEASLYYFHPDNQENPSRYDVFEVEEAFYHNFILDTPLEELEISLPSYMKRIGTVTHESPSSSMTKKEILETLSQNESNNNAMSNFFKQIKINIQVIRLNIEEQIFNLKEKLKRGLKNIFKIRGVS